MDEQQTPRAAGYTRALALFVLLAGVVIMHSGAFAPSGGGHHGATGPEASRLTVHSADPSAHAPSCSGGDCTPNNAGSHGCVFVLTALALALVLAALYWVGWTRPGCTGPRPRWWRAKRSRPPPWTVLTLAELAILRI
ncbi:DUF6153 family protein [Nocardia otitidiscaviarum]|uniref:Uncharacterized protein n=1 Tax=Nocardia otitidiscaviarum TaxID=1823 RepID=A0A516NFQ2_9NOCA|nr:DUF6153 family protein [Nocardia otitidiscaviarum]MBF6178300.1 hypothetical protein [Nocardia otitidiscaviarum]MCP9623067.1 DUF6153 family protein [Nocardia otitidiscaviarum]QDP77734.1 hypothetical protein FOH10_02210 [Nocardia otitidiscaviarum]